jgi:hypothetical protein
MRPRTLGALALGLALAALADARAQLPKSQVPGASPAGKMDDPTPRIPAGQTTPTARPDPNFPTPEPVAPKGKPDEAPSLPGSGRTDVVPGS